MNSKGPYSALHPFSSALFLNQNFLFTPASPYHSCPSYLLLTPFPALFISCSPYLLLTSFPALLISSAPYFLLSLSPALPISCSPYFLLTPSPALLIFSSAHPISCSSHLLLTPSPAHLEKVWSDCIESTSPAKSSVTKPMEKYKCR